MVAFRFLFCLSLIWLLAGALPAQTRPPAAAPAPTAESADTPRPRSAPPEDEILGVVPEPATWAAGSMALALTVFLFLRHAKKWDQERASGR